MSKRVNYIANILKGEQLNLINKLFENYSIPTKNNISTTNYDYVLNQLKNSKSKDLKYHEKCPFLSFDLHYNESFLRYFNSEIWSKNSFKIYVSHVNSNKIEAILLEKELNKYGISTYLPRVNNMFVEEKLARSEEALKSCDAFVFLLDKGTKFSYKCNLEIGVAIGRGIPVLQVKLNDSKSFGMLKKYEVIEGKDYEGIAENIFLNLVNNEGVRDLVVNSLINQFETSNSFQNARDNMSYIEKNTFWNIEFLDKLEKALNGNSEISDSFGVSQRVFNLINKESKEIK